jgi:hypothetical protein
MKTTKSRNKKTSQPTTLLPFPRPTLVNRPAPDPGLAIPLASKASTDDLDWLFGPERPLSPSSAPQPTLIKRLGPDPEDRAITEVEGGCTTDDAEDPCLDEPDDFEELPISRRLQLRPDSDGYDLAIVLVDDDGLEEPDVLFRPRLHLPRRSR